MSSFNLAQPNGILSTYHHAPEITIGPMANRISGVGRR
jgi:hypothetical protein